MISIHHQSLSSFCGLFIILPPLWCVCGGGNDRCSRAGHPLVGDVVAVVHHGPGARLPAAWAMPGPSAMAKNKLNLSCCYAPVLRCGALLLLLPRKKLTDDDCARARAERVRDSFAPSPNQESMMMSICVRGS